MVDTVKGSALVSLVGIADLMLSVQKVAGRTYDALPVYIVHGRRHKPSGEGRRY